MGALENLFRRSREAGVVLARARQRSSPSCATDQGSVDVAKQPMGDSIENDRGSSGPSIIWDRGSGFQPCGGGQARTLRLIRPRTTTAIRIRGTIDRLLLVAHRERARRRGREIEELFRGDAVAR